MRCNLVKSLWLCVLLSAVTACPPAPPPVSTQPAATQPAASYVLTSARRQASFLAVALPAGGPFAALEIASATGPEVWPPSGVTLYTGQLRTGPICGPMVDQLFGTPTVQGDAGTILVPAAVQDGPNLRTFTLAPGVCMLRVQVPALLAAGTYRFPLTFVAAGGARVGAELQVQVSDISLLSEGQVIATATATVAEMSAAYPETFGKLQAMYLDRSDTEHAAAVAQLDEVVKTAQRHGVAFYLEDLAPTVKIDEVGRVLVDWEAYDRTIGPYLDGTAFPDRTPLPLWLAPAPPRRIRDTPTQLRQYLQACAEHYRERAWTAQPAFMHAALIDLTADPALRKAVLEVIARHLDRSFALIATPDVASALKPMWVVLDEDPRLPPAGMLATAESLRAWPWMCAARGLRGMVWRNALGAGEGAVPLLMPQPPVLPAAEKGKSPAALLMREPALSLRLAWLTAGLNDCAHFALVERRSDPAVAQEILAGLVGRTGLGAPESSRTNQRGGYLYAGWPGDATTWDTLPQMLDRLILAADPGAKTKIAADDPLLLQTKVWLAKARRPVARPISLSFSLTPGRDGTLVQAAPKLVVENPIGAETEMALRWAPLPGDLALRNSEPLKLPPYGLLQPALALEGHLESLREGPRPTTLELRERTGGARLDVPTLVPIYRMRPAAEAPKIDGKGDDWPQDAYIQAYGPMRVELGYQSRSALLAGKLRMQKAPATVRWSFSSDYLYALVRVPQESTSDDRSSEWPLTLGRWWASDVVQMQLVGGGPAGPATKVVQIAIKPTGVALVRAAPWPAQGAAKWTDGPTGLKHAVVSDKHGYTVELALPRKWFPNDHDRDPATAVWRVNVLRHRASDLQSTSWSGPVIDDSDLEMMGLLIGGE